jgi:hypothetical protein
MNELAVVDNSALSQTGFDHIQRVAKLFSESQLVPTLFQKNLPNVVIGLEIAQRIGASPMMVFQNLHVIHGKPSFGASFMIATVNACGRFTPLRFIYTGERGTPQWGCSAVAKAKIDGAECKGVTVTMEIAVAEGWTTKAGSKWKTMPELMLSYRAATWWVRMFSPELLMGFPTADEVTDVELAPAVVEQQDNPNAGQAATRRRTKGVSSIQNVTPADAVAAAQNVAPESPPSGLEVYTTRVITKEEIAAALSPEAPPVSEPEKETTTPVDEGAPEMEPAPAKTRCEIVSISEVPARLQGGVVGQICKILFKGDFAGMAYYNGPRSKLPADGSVIDAVLVPKMNGQTKSTVLESFEVLA